MAHSKPKIVAVVGTNASGKSSLGIYLAHIFDGEIISADSRQVYRGLDIGTGKLTKEEMEGVPHHLIDVESLERRFSLADFQTRAYEIIDQLLERRKLPLIVGGTGLYVRSVVEGYQLVPAPPDLAMRDRLEALSDRELWDTLAELDPQAAEIIDFRNRRRLIRTIEMVSQGFEYRVSPEKQNRPRYEALQLGLTWPTPELRRRIDERLRARLDQGMVDEVRALLESGVSRERLDGLGLEYRYVVRYLDNEFHTEEELYDKLSRAIHRFANRQLSWFRRDHSIIWLDTSADYRAEAVSRVTEFLKR